MRGHSQQTGVLGAEPGLSSDGSHQAGYVQPRGVRRLRSIGSTPAFALLVAAIAGGGAMVSLSVDAQVAAPVPARSAPAVKGIPGPAAEGAAKGNNAPAGPPTAVPAVAPQTSVEQAFYLVRSTLLSLNDANRSGNYSVLRDLAAPDFAARNSAASLAISFNDLRQRKFDLFAVALIAPQFKLPPRIDGNQVLHLVGSFPTRPLQIDFNLAFQSVGGQWRLVEISVVTPEAPADVAATAPTKPGR